MEFTYATECQVTDDRKRYVAASRCIKVFIGRLMKTHRSWMDPECIVSKIQVMIRIRGEHVICGKRAWKVQRCRAWSQVCCIARIIKSEHRVKNVYTANDQYSKVLDKFICRPGDHSPENDNEFRRESLSWLDSWRSRWGWNTSNSLTLFHHQIVFRVYNGKPHKWDTRGYRNVDFHFYGKPCCRCTKFPCWITVKIACVSEEGLSQSYKGVMKYLFETYSA